MANIWKVNRNVNNNAKRNNFDLSFQNHLTMKMGTLYPVFCKEVVPGDSFRINSAFGLKFMPLAFPVQSKMRAHMHFYYVRNKNLWNRWQDWLEGLKTESDGVVHPYIQQHNDFFKTGSLSDYLGVPTTLASAGSVHFLMHPYSSQTYYPFQGKSGISFVSSLNRPVSGSPDNSTGFVASDWFGLNPFAVNEYMSFEQMLIQSESNLPYYFSLFGWNDYLLTDRSVTLSYRFTANSQLDFQNVGFFILTRPKGDTTQSNWLLRAHYWADSVVSHQYNESGNLVCNLPSACVDEWNGFIGQGLECAFAVVVLRQTVFEEATDNVSFIFTNGIAFKTNSVSVNDTDVPCPFDDSDLENHNKIRISALPYRAYESVYYSFYNNNILQPLRINGEVEYNKYNTTTDGGADTTPYHLFQRNYELDFLTSALPSPQQGNAPLVGLSPLTGQITVRDPDDPTIVTTAQAIIDNDQIVGVNVTSPIANKEHALTLQEIASVGMSINSFRNANALQRWLENTIRKGSYRYQDFIEAHFGVRPKYNELDMPEFIGGFSRDVNVSQIISTADTLGISGQNSGQSVGSFNGMASCFGGSKHSISHFCDDYGFIIGILCITPTPSYSQLLPKHFLKYNPLDYYFEEMSQLGMQPITYEEVCPIQAYYQATVLEDGTNVRDTFGYQRPNYDLVASVDEIHGQFRQSLNSFLINRVFQSRPQLGDDFLKIDPDETNQIFIDQAPDSDNIIGQVVFDVKAKRPLPVVHMPSLGR